MNFCYDKDCLLTILDNKLSRNEVRKQIPLSFKEFMKTQFCENSSDIFGDSNILVTYDKDDILSGIELYRGEIGFFFFRKQILGTSLTEIEKFFTEMHVDYLIDEYGLIVPKYNMELYIPDIESQTDALVESVYLKRCPIRTTDTVTLS